MTSVIRHPLPSDLSMPAALRCFDDCVGLLVLDSSQRRPQHDGRYSFLTADAVRTVRIDRVVYGCDPFQQVRQLQGFLPAVPEDAPPFCGGLAGLLGYEIGAAFEQLPVPGRDEFATPDLLAGLYDWAIVWDHLHHNVTLWCVDLNGVGLGSKSRRDWVIRKLTHGRSVSVGVSADDDRVWSDRESVLPVRSVFEPEQFVSSVQRVIDYIAAGDIFQANLAQQLTAEWLGTAVELFEQVRLRNPAPFSGLMQASDFAVVSASPERFLKVDGSGHVQTRPIKGTRRRQQSPIADLMTGEELKASGKDRSENVMIVDLLRNDLSRVCQTGSVRVTGVCELEVFETVQHLVSTVVGHLRPDCDVWDLCAATLPGGSITGAPKIRAMEIIAELEPVVRGAYCGNLFYCGPNGYFDSSILIRTFTLKDGRVQFPVGGGIVADSDPVQEYEETMHKAAGMLRVLQGSLSSRPVA